VYLWAGTVIKTLKSEHYYSVLSSRSKPSANRAAAALRLAANSLYRSKSALGAFLRRKKAEHGAPQAITATAHKLARLTYPMLKYGQDMWTSVKNITNADTASVP
jgi:hypothetical protein